METIARKTVIRQARCGHEYEASPNGGRQRNCCPDCDPSWAEGGWRSAYAERMARDYIQTAEERRFAAIHACPGCGVVFTPQKTVSQIYCSKSCLVAHRVAQQSARNAARRDATIKVCPQCSVEFTPARTMKQRFCSKVCNAAFHRDNSGATCKADGCDRPVRARGMCSMHWRRWARETGREKNPAWNERRRANYHKRRALKAAAPAADIAPDEIFERDGWCCGLCGGEIDRAAQWPDPESASLDHVVPLSKGGHHIPDNVQAAHLSCNVRKGAAAPVDA